MEDFDAYWIDEKISGEIKTIVSSAANKYNIPVGEWIDHIVYMLYGDFFSEDSGMDKNTRETKRIREAYDIVNFTRLAGDAKISTPRETICIGVDALKKIQSLIAPEIEDIMNMGTLIGYTAEEKHIRLQALAEEAEFKRNNFFNVKLRDYTTWFVSMGMFSVPNKEPISDAGGAFLYDIFFAFKYSMGVDLPIDWDTETKDTAPAETNAEKQGVISKRLKGKKLKRPEIR